MRRWATIAAIGLIALSGCGQDAPREQPDATSADQSASIVRTFAPAERMEASLLIAYTDIFICGPGLSAVPPVPAGSSRSAVRHTPGTKLNYATAVLIDGRGYYATAAHAVGPDPILILAPCSGPSSGAGNPRPARVVYRGSGAFDFALLFAPGANEQRVPWLPTDRLAIGTPLVGAGESFPADAPTTGFHLQAYAGRLLEVNPETGPDGPYMRLVGTQPAVHGDSGGPQFAFPADRQGRGLVGIAVAAQLMPDGQRRTHVVRPDLDWLGRLIDNDQRTLAAIPPSTRP